MSDNSQLIPGTATGDFVRMVDRGAGFKEQVVVLDLGGPNTNGENLLTGEMPSRIANVSTTGSISAVDANLAAPGTIAVFGAPTANSFAFLLLKGGEDQFGIMLSGPDPGTIVYYNLEFSPDTTNGTDGSWFALYARQRGLMPGATADVLTMAPNTPLTAVGFFAGDLPPAKGIRVRARGTGTSAGTKSVLISAGIAGADMGIQVLNPIAISQVTPGSTNRVALAPVTVSGTISAVNANLTSGTPTANSTVTISGLGDATQISISVETSFVGTLQVQVSDAFGNNWESNTNISGITRTASGAQSSTILNPGIYEFNTGGAPNARVTCSAYSTGSPTVGITASAGNTLVTLDAPIPTGSSTIGSIASIVSSLPAGTNLAMDVGLGARATANGFTLLRVTSAATTNGTAGKVSAGRLYRVQLTNRGTAEAVVKLYNKASAPTVGTDTPLYVIPLAPNFGACDLAYDGHGEYFSTGIAYAITGGIADSDTTAVAANQVVGKILYA